MRLTELNRTSDVILSLRKFRHIINSPHFWILTVTIIFLAVLYSSWPWRSWSLVLGTWPLGTSFDSLNKLADLEFRYHTIGILFVLPILYSAVVFGWWGALVSWIFCILPLLPIIIKLWPSVSIIVANMAFLLIPFFVVLIVAVELEWRRRERRAFANREEQQRLYVSKLHEETEKARRHLAQELHDDSIQMLLTVNTHVETLMSPGPITDGHNIETTASWIHDTISQTVDNMRRVCLNLRPSMLDDLGLVPALRWLVDNANAESDTAIRIKVIGEEKKLPVRLEDNVFRLVQAALSNIRRHSEAEKAMVTVEFDEGRLILLIEDNGRGFNIPKGNNWFDMNGKLGLIGMYQRVSSLDGVFEIRSKPGEGTVITIELGC